jgi:DNA-directed RNA polymerase subunit beta
MTANPPKYRRIRKNFGHIQSIVDIPDLIGMQRESYDRFLQMYVKPEKRKDTGLQSVFNSVFPIVLPEPHP